MLNAASAPLRKLHAAKAAKGPEESPLAPALHLPSFARSAARVVTLASSTRSTSPAAEELPEELPLAAARASRFAAQAASSFCTGMFFMRRAPTLVVLRVTSKTTN